MLIIWRSGEMADTTDLKSVGASREGSSPSFATIFYENTN